MRRLEARLHVLDDGRLEVVDPGWEHLALFEEMDPDYQVPAEPLPGSSVPRLELARCAGAGVAAQGLERLPDARLWAIHDRSEKGTVAPGEASLLDVKAELAARLLRGCQLCARRCAVDRTRGERGRCGLGRGAKVVEHFVHIGEEPPINPSLLVSLAGCGLCCAFCQQRALLSPDGIDGSPLTAGLWQALDAGGARTLSFIGGNPSESLPSILGWLGAAPSGWNLPLVWNCSGYETPEVVALLDGVVDAYVPDFKFGQTRCARSLAGAPDYPSVARVCIGAMLEQGVPVIVRVLLLPGHIECCAVPILHSLAALKTRGLLRLSLRAQYRPEGGVGAGHPGLHRRVTRAEIGRAQETAARLGLTPV